MNFPAIINTKNLTKNFDIQFFVAQILKFWYVKHAVQKKYLSEIKMYLPL